MSDVLYPLDFIPQQVASQPIETKKEGFSIGEKVSAVCRRAFDALINLFIPAPTKTSEPLRVQLFDFDAETAELDQEEEEFRLKWWEYPIALILYINNLRH